MMKKNILFIVIMWSLLAFVSYNVLTVEAEEKTGFLREDYDWDEFYDDTISRYDVDVKCDATEDYESNEKACKKAYQKIEKQEQDSIKHIEAGKEKAAKEDAICDNEDADTTNVELCMSDKRKQQIENIEKACDKVDGKMTKDGCDTDGSGDTPKADRFNDELMKLEAETGYPSISEEPTEVIEDWGNTVTDSKEQAVKEVIKQISSGDPDNRVETPVEQRYSPEEDTSSEEATEDEEEAMEEADDEEESNEDDSEDDSNEEDSE